MLLIYQSATVSDHVYDNDEGITVNRIVIFIVLMVLLAMASAVEASVSHVSEQCGRWTVSFDWSDTDGYAKSVSQADNEDKKVKIYTDTLTLTSDEDPLKTIKISIMKYSKWNSSLVEQSNLMNLANSALIKSGSCKDIRVSSGEIGGNPGMVGSGSGCKNGQILHVAVYCVDGSSPAIVPSTLAIILSTYDQDSTDRLVNSMHIE
jgi:hypothetical protein